MVVVLLQLKNSKQSHLRYDAVAVVQALRFAFLVCIRKLSMWSVQWGIVIPRGAPKTDSYCRKYVGSGLVLNPAFGVDGKVAPKSWMKLIYVGSYVTQYFFHSYFSSRNTQTVQPTNQSSSDK